MFDPYQIKKDFPIFDVYSGNEPHQKPLVYLDNAATTQKPRAVLDAITNFYTHYNANVSRSSHFLADKATDMYENARTAVAHFINANSSEEIVFTKNATEGLNLVALTWGMQNLQKGDVVLTTSAEHNSSILPWEAAAKAKGAKVKCLIMDDSGHLRGDWASEFTEDVKVVVMTHVSNVLGVINPIREISKKAKEIGALVVVDGSQAIPYKDINLNSLGCDFYAFSGHKMLGPMGIGVLWGRKELLNQMLPLSFGGGTVKSFGVDEGSLLEVPHRFEAGTPNVAGAVGLAAAIEYINGLGIFGVEDYVADLVKYAYYKLTNIAGLRILGPKLDEERSGLVSFYVEGVHSHDISAVLNNEGIAVRSGLHCSMNLYKDLEIPSTTRASFYVYNTKDDVNALVQGVRKALKLLQ